MLDKDGRNIDMDYFLQVKGKSVSLLWLLQLELFSAVL